MRLSHLLAWILLLDLAAPAAAAVEWVAADVARVRERPSSSARTIVKLEPGERLRVLKRRAHWVRVEASGEVGWVERTAVVAARPKSPPREIAEAEVLPAPPPARKRHATIAELGERADQEPTIALDTPPPPPPPGPLRLAGQLGMRHFSGLFDSNGDGTLGRYRYSSDAALVALRADASLRIGPVTFAADGRYAYGYASPGMRYRDGLEMDDVAYKTHDFDLGARAGTRLGGALVSARLGFRYGFFDVERLDTVARWPRETLAGPVAGVRVEAPDFFSGLDLAAGADLLVDGRLTQTTGLEDGSSRSVRGGWAHVDVSGRIGPRLALIGSYQLGWVAARFHGASTRQADVTEATRTETSHVLLFGVGHGF